jgi:hypothetical protein
MTQPPRDGDATLDRTLDDRLRFEQYLADVAARLLGLPGEAVEAAIKEALHGLLEALGVDRCGLSLFDERTEGLRIAYSVSRSGVPIQPLVDIAPLLPWYTRQAREGRTLVWPRLPEGIPPEATAELAYVSQTGMKAHVSVPFRAGGETQGGLGVATWRAS